MRVIGHMVVRNEADRYLRSCLEALRPQVDELTVFDDRSSDETFEIASGIATACAQRFDPEPSFADHEGAFRHIAWRWMEAAVKPEPGDWILCLDADEFLVCTDAMTSVAAALHRAAEMAELAGLAGVSLPVPEVFGWDSGVPLVRVDGFWAAIVNARFVGWRPGGEFRPTAMASGSVPTYVRDGGSSIASCGLHILHFGYAEEDDRREKFHRYTDVAGHNPGHVASILQRPETRPWPGPVPVVRRGN